MIRPALLALAILSAGCESNAPDCPPALATHRMQCAGIGEFQVYENGGVICHFYGGEIRIEGAACVLVPMTYPDGGTDGPGNP